MTNPNNHGGYRRPSQPAAVSGPGALSQRTDGRPQPIRDLPNANYGEAQQFRELQQGAPMARTPGTPSTPAPGNADPLAGVTSLSAPTTSPATPVTDGANAGAGAGMDALGLPANYAKADAQQLQPLLPMLIRRAQDETATPSFKRFVRILLAQQ